MHDLLRALSLAALIVVLSACGSLGAAQVEEPNLESTEPTGEGDSTDQPVIAGATATTASPSGGFGCTINVSPGGSIEAAADSAGPGDTVCIPPGDYAPFTNKSDGTAIQRLRIVSTVKHGAHIQGSGSGNGISNLGQYVDIEGFEVSNFFDGIVNGDGAHANHVTISHNYVHDTSAMGIISVNWTSAAKYQGVDVEIFNNIVDNTGVGRGDGRGHNIYVSHPQSKIYNNVTLGTPGWGIHLWHNGSDSEIYNNYVEDSYGIVAGTGNVPCGTITCKTGGYNVHDNVVANARKAIDLRGTGDNSTNGNAFFQTPDNGGSSYGSDPILLSSAPDPFANNRG